MLAIVGVVNVPIIKYSVEWWNSLHQTATVDADGQARHGLRHGVAAAADVRWLSLLYFVAVLLIRLRAELLRRERNASWVREVLA